MKHRRSKVLVITLLSLFVFEFAPLSAQPIAQWRGQNRDGQYSGTNLLNAWPEAGPELLWFTEEIGNGYGAPSIVNDRIYINGEIDSTSYLFAFDLKGKLLWKSPNGKEFTGSGFSNRFPGSRSAPTIVGNLAYVCSGIGRIACFETSGGAEKWSIDMMKDLGGCAIEFGYSESLLVVGNKVFCFPGGPSVNAAAFDRFTGKPVWASKVLGDTTTYCSPMLITLPSRKLVLNYSRYDLFALDAATGELLWSYPIKNAKNDAQRSNTPIYRDGYIYVVSGEENGKGAVKLALSADGKSVTEVWHNYQIRSAMGGFVIANNSLFATVERNVLRALDLTSGLVVDSVKVRHGSLIFADNKIFTYGNTGDVTLVTYDQNKLAIAGKLKINKGSKDHFAHPVIADGVLYIRRGKGLMAYKVD